MSLLETLEFSSHNEANGDLSEGSHLEMVTSSKNRGSVQEEDINL